MSESGPIKIDLHSLVRSRAGRWGALLPRFAVYPLERLVCQKELNALLSRLYPRRGADFCRALLSELDITLDVAGTDRLPACGRALFVSNHPLGGLDGISMLAFLGGHYGCEPYFVVNDLLMAVEPLSGNFVPVSIFGRQRRTASEALTAALASHAPIVIYPAGLVSRRADNGTIADLKWNKTFINKAIESRRDIVPVYFGGTNSAFFYRLARLRRRLHIPFNLEMTLLPREMLRRRHCTFRLSIGAPVPWSSLNGGSHAADEAARLRTIVYNLADK